MRIKSTFIGAVCSILSLMPAASKAVSFPNPPKATSKPSKPGKLETIILAGGCFWGVEAVFDHLQGVKSAVSGYAGGTKESAEYYQVARGDTGHAEAVEVTYDPSQISLGEILKVYFSIAHDPTQVDRQGPDLGPQYRSEIFYSTPEQEKIAHDYIALIDASKVYSAPVATRLSHLTAFYPAEEYHQNYLALNPTQPYIVVHDLPKLAALKKRFPELYEEKQKT